MRFARRISLPVAFCTLVLTLMIIPFQNFDFWAQTFNIVSLDFARPSYIDKSGFQNRNPNRNFYFNFHSPLPNGAMSTHRMVAEPGSHFAADLIHGPQEGQSSLRLQLRPYEDGCTSPKISGCRKRHPKDKVQLTPVDFRSEYGVDIREGKTRYVGFDFKLDKSYQVGQGLPGSRPFVLHFQVWQCCSTPPPFSIVVEPADAGEDPGKKPVTLIFVARDDVGFNSYKSQFLDKKVRSTLSYTWGKEIFRMNMPRDEWARFTLQLQPSFNGDGKAGRIAFWLNGTQMFDYVGDWGFKPDPGTPAQKYYVPNMPAAWVPQLPLLTSALDIYRAPFQTSTQTVEFSRYREGDSLESVR